MAPVQFPFPRKVGKCREDDPYNGIEIPFRDPFSEKLRNKCRPYRVCDPDADQEMPNARVVEIVGEVLGQPSPDDCRSQA